MCLFIVISLLKMLFCILKCIVKMDGSVGSWVVLYIYQDFFLSFGNIIEMFLKDDNYF